MRIGEVLKNCHEKRGLSHSALSRLVNINADYIIRIENGSNEPRVGTVLRILDALDYDFEIVDLLEGSESIR